jgi:hypothetical protein
MSETCKPIHTRRFSTRLGLVAVLSLAGAALAALIASGVAAQGPQPQAANLALGSGFTYQGFLKQNGAVVNGNCDLQFALYDASAGGARLGVTETMGTLTVTNGAFSAVLNDGGAFGPLAFNGDARFLDIRARCPAGVGAFTALGRQRLTSTPYALALPGLWTEQNAVSPNLIGGFSGNNIVTASHGSVIGGGGSAGSSNQIDGNRSVIAGGSRNFVNSSDDSFIGGGFSNTVTGHEDVIAGGGANMASGDHSAILGGINNVVSGDEATIGGGQSNAAGGQAATITGGSGNWSSGDYGTVGGGSSNFASGYAGTVPGGYGNYASAAYSFAAGKDAVSIYTGTFVWADATGPGFFSGGINQFLIRAGGGVGIGNPLPETQLHVVKSANGSGTNPGDNVAVFQNTNPGNSADVLALKIGGTVTPSMSNNFITFLLGNNTSVGAIQGNGNGSVELAGAGNDYAEWLPRLNLAEPISPGDIVGIVDGRVTKDTREASQVMVISTGPIVAGNDPGEAARSGYAQVAFIGQVIVRVRGPVQGGDFIVPSGLNDGSGMAVAPEAVTAEQLAQVAGEAWEAAPGAGVKSVRIAVGLTRNDSALKRVMERGDAQARQLAVLEARVNRLEQAGGGQQLAAPWWLAAGAMAVMGVWLARQMRVL